MPKSDAGCGDGFRSVTDCNELPGFLMFPSHPVVLCVSGHDPSGGAGVQADIESLAALGCHALSVISALTLQDTRNVRRIIPQAAGQMLEQIRLLFEDMEIACIKIGLLGSLEAVGAVRSILMERPEIPVVLDPVLAAGGGFDFSGPDLVRAMVSDLIPLATVVTPNCAEARRLCPVSPDLDACGEALNALGCAHVLISGADEAGLRVVNRYYRAEQPVHVFEWERLTGAFHGSGCTLAAAIAAYLARGAAVFDAISGAQQFTWDALNAGFRAGKGQILPDRLAGRRRD